MAVTGLTRRTVLAVAAAAPFAAPAAAEADWPNRPVRVMVPYPPAGGADTTARILYATLSEDLGQQFAIENRGGAGGTIGEAVVAKAEPDGYTILHDATAFSVNASLYANLPFDYRKDFDPVFLVVAGAEYSGRHAIGAGEHASPTSSPSPKRRPTASTWRRPATARCSISCLELFARTAGIKINHVPYRGGGLALTDVMAGPGEILLRQRLLGDRPDQGRQSQSDRAYRQRPAREPAGYSADVRYLAGI